jgi:hypothetical protein
MRILCLSQRKAGRPRRQGPIGMQSCSQHLAIECGDAHGCTLPSLKVALGLELLDGFHERAARDLQCGRKLACRREWRVRREPATKNSVPQLPVDLPAQGPAVSIQADQ